MKGPPEYNQTQVINTILDWLALHLKGQGLFKSDIGLLYAIQTLLTKGTIS